MPIRNYSYLFRLLHPFCLNFASEKQNRKFNKTKKYQNARFMHRGSAKAGGELKR
jgi:hypothetical protein